MTIAELKERAQGQFTPEEYERIAKLFRVSLETSSMPMPTNTPYSRQYDDMKIRVLDLEFYSKHYGTRKPLISVVIRYTKSTNRLSSSEE